VEEEDEGVRGERGPRTNRICLRGLAGIGLRTVLSWMSWEHVGVFCDGFEIQLGNADRAANHSATVAWQQVRTVSKSRTPP
jgi:hypothetical protein